MNNQCEHGQLARSCEMCELQQQLTTVTAERDTAQKLLLKWQCEHDDHVSELTAELAKLRSEIASVEPVFMIETDKNGFYKLVDTKGDPWQWSAFGAGHKFYSRSSIQEGKVKELEAEIAKWKRGFEIYETVYKNAYDENEQLQAQVAQLRDALSKVSNESLGLTHYGLQLICEQAISHSPSHWLERKLLEARIDEQLRSSGAGQIDKLRYIELRAQLQQLEGGAG